MKPSSSQRFKSGIIPDPDVAEFTQWTSNCFHSFPL